MDSEQTVLATMRLSKTQMLAAEKSKATFIAPIGIGLALFVAEIAGIFLISSLVFR
jgi:aquaporin rerated protein, other eukaryote